MESIEVVIPPLLSRVGEIYAQVATAISRPEESGHVIWLVWGSDKWGIRGKWGDG